MDGSFYNDDRCCNITKLRPMTYQWPITYYLLPMIHDMPYITPDIGSPWSTYKTNYFDCSDGPENMIWGWVQAMFYVY